MTYLTNRDQSGNMDLDITLPHLPLSSLVALSEKCLIFKWLTGTGTQSTPRDTSRLQI